MGRFARCTWMTFRVSWKELNQKVSDELRHSGQEQLNFTYVRKPDKQIHLEKFQRVLDIPRAYPVARSVYDVTGAIKATEAPFGFTNVEVRSLTQISYDCVAQTAKRV